MLSPIVRDWTTWAKPFNEAEWEKMKRLLLKHQVGLWEDQYAYQNLMYGQQATVYQENRNAAFRTQGKFFNITTPFRYLGIDEKEKQYRSSYEGDILITMDGETNQAEHYGGYSYNSYAIPPSYNKYAEELWDYVIGYTGGIDWREKAG